MTRRADPWLRVRAVIAIAFAIPSLILLASLMDPAAVLLVSSYLLTGFVLVVRRPRQPIAWMLVVAATGLALGSVRVSATLDDLRAGDADTVGAFTAWANGVGWNLVFAAFLGIGLLFPNGTMPRGRWGVVASMLVAAFIPIAIVNTFGRTLSINVSGYAGTVTVPNPAGWVPSEGDVTDLLFPAVFALSVVARVYLLARFRVSTGVERLQYRWLVWAFVVVAGRHARLGVRRVHPGRGHARWWPTWSCWSRTPLSPSRS